MRLKKVEWGLQIIHQRLSFHNNHANRSHTRYSLNSCLYFDIILLKKVEWGLQTIHQWLSLHNNHANRSHTRYSLNLCLYFDIIL